MKVANFGKRGDVGITLIDFLLRQAENGGVEINILPTREFGIESGAEFQECGDPALYVGVLRSWALGFRQQSEEACSFLNRSRR